MFALFNEITTYLSLNLDTGLVLVILYSTLVVDRDF